MSASTLSLSPQEVSAITENLHFVYLPEYTLFLLRNKIPEFGRESLLVSRQIKLPLLKYFESFSDDQLLAMGNQGNIDILKALSENNALSFIDASLKRWLTNQIPHISRDAVAVEDITQVSLMRRMVFRNLLPSYTSELATAVKILEEIDRFTTLLDSICLNRLAALQQDLFKQAEKLAKIGSWVMNLETGKLLWSDEMFRIYEMEPEADLSKEKAGILNYPDDQPVVDKNILGALTNHRPYDFYYRIQLPDGRLKHIHAKGEVRLNKNGEPSDLFGSAQDVTLQKSTEGLLSEKQQLIGKIADLAPSLIALYNVHTRQFIFINKALNTLLGYEEADAFAKGIEFLGALIHPDDLKSLSERNLQALQAAKTLTPGSPEIIAEFTYRIKHKNNEYRWFRTQRTVFNRNNENQPENVLSISVDITDEHSLLNRVEDEKAFAEMITDVSINRVQAFDSSFRYIIWNKQCELFYGKTKSEVLGKSALEVFPNAKDSVLFNYFDRALKGEFIHLKQQEFTFSEGWGEMFFIPLKKGPAVVGAMCIINDITELKKANSDLKQLNAAFEHAEDIANMGHWQWNLKTNVLTFSDNQYRMLGVSPQSFVPTIQNFMQFVHPDDQQLIYDAEDRDLKENEGSEALFRVIRKDGSLRFFHSNGRILTNESGDKLMTGVNRDITDQHLLTLRLEEQNVELQTKNKELQSFNYIASHDLQEPLRKIIFFSNMILDEKAEGLRSDFDNYCRKINSAARRMRELIDNLLTFASIQNDVNSYQAVDLDEQITMALGSLSITILETNAVINFDTRSTIVVIPFQFRQVMENLIGNALKYRRKGVAPVIEISAQKIKGSEIRQPGALPEKEYLEIAVADNGIGFNPEYIEKIFQPFQRLHSRTEYPGTGIGLSICKKIIDIHNGFIWARSDENSGSIFYLYLPLR